MKSKKTWIILIAVLLVVAALIVVILRHNGTEQAEPEQQDAQSAEPSAEVEQPGKTETPAASEATDETGEEAVVGSVTVPDGMELGGDDLD